MKRLLLCLSLLSPAHAQLLPPPAVRTMPAAPPPAPVMAGEWNPISDLTVRPGQDAIITVSTPQGYLSAVLVRPDGRVSLIGRSLISRPVSAGTTELRLPASRLSPGLNRVSIIHTTAPITFAQARTLKGERQINIDVQPEHLPLYLLPHHDKIAPPSAPGTMPLPG